MSDLSVFTFSGRLTRNAELKTIGAKSSLLTTFTVANTTGYGNYARTQFYDCQLWGVKGQNLINYLTKGKQVLITGTLENAKWQSEDNLMHDKWQVTINDIVLLQGGSNTTSKEEPLPTKPTDAGYEQIPF